MKTSRIKLFVIGAVLLAIVACAVVVLADFLRSDKPIVNTDAIKKQNIFALYDSYKKRSFPAVADISATELLGHQEKQALVIVDVRDAREQRVSMLPHAITRDDFERDRDHYRNTTIVAYCTIGDRSGRYVRWLNEEGRKAYNLIGGILAWAHAGQPFYAQNKPTNRVHVYGKQWNLLPEGYEAVW